MAFDPITAALDVIKGSFDFAGKFRESMDPDLRKRLDTIMIEDMEFWHDLTAQLRVDAKKTARGLEPSAAHPPPAVATSPPK